MTASGKTIRTLIVDDEPLARRRIRRLLSTEGDFEIIGECGEGRSAAEAMIELKPDLVFLDVQMPEVDGFQALERVPSRALPLVIFVTAYDGYALRAFEVSAVDYLLKPFDRSRFEKAVERAKVRLASGPEGGFREQTLALLQQLRAKGNGLDRLVIKTSGRGFFLKVDEIDWIEAEGKYVRLHVGKDSYLLREAIGALESQLDPARFPRIHRSAIVNIERVRELQPWFNGEYKVVLRDGTELMLSRSFRKKLSELLGGS